MKFDKNAMSDLVALSVGIGKDTVQRYVYKLSSSKMDWNRTRCLGTRSSSVCDPTSSSGSDVYCNLIVSG